MVKFALVQLSKKHTEIFGTFIELFLRFGWDFTIYYNLENDPYTFLKYYETLFEIELEIRNTNDLLIDKDRYDFFIFTSSADDVRMNDWFKSPEQRSKCIFVQHQAAHWRSYMHNNILMSSVIKSGELDKENNICIIPVYKEYKKFHSQVKKLRFAVIGAVRINQEDKDLSLLIDLLEKYGNEDYKVYVFMRKMDWLAISRRNEFLRKNKRIENYPGLSTEKMIEKLKDVKFILPLSKQGGWFYWQRLTGTIPLAVNLNIPMVMDRKLSEIYGIEEGCILYESRISEVMDRLICLTDEEYYRLVEGVVMYKKRQYLRNKRNLLNLCLGNG